MIQPMDQSTAKKLFELLNATVVAEMVGPGERLSKLTANLRKVARAVSGGAVLTDSQLRSVARDFAEARHLADAIGEAARMGFRMTSPENIAVRVEAANDLLMKVVAESGNISAKA